MSPRNPSSLRCFWSEYFITVNRKKTRRPILPYLPPQRLSNPVLEPCVYKSPTICQPALSPIRQRLSKLSRLASSLHCPSEATQELGCQVCTGTPGTIKVFGQGWKKSHSFNDPRQALCMLPSKHSTVYFNYLRRQRLGSSWDSLCLSVN